MSPVLQLLTDILALLNTPQGMAVIADLEALLGVTPPPPPPAPQQTPAQQTTAPTNIPGRRGAANRA